MHFYGRQNYSSIISLYLSNECEILACVQTVLIDIYLLNLLVHFLMTFLQTFEYMLKSRMALFCVFVQLKVVLSEFTLTSQYTVASEHP